jgi:hypothetical protein
MIYTSLNDLVNTNTKKIIYTPEVLFKNKNINKNINKSKSKHESKEENVHSKRIECNNWFIQPALLEHAPQLEILKNAVYPNDNGTLLPISYFIEFPLFKKQIEHKLYGYKQQDIKKHLFIESKLITFDETIVLLHKSALVCAYCDVNVFVLYENVRDPCQWSLDRIDNNAGHNADNLLIACLRCNLRRRRINMDSFMFTKKMKLVKNGH